MKNTFSDEKTEKTGSQMPHNQIKSDGMSFDTTQKPQMDFNAEKIIGLDIESQDSEVGIFGNEFILGIETELNKIWINFDDDKFWDLIEILKPEILSHIEQWEQNKMKYKLKGLQFKNFEKMTDDFAEVKKYARAMLRINHLNGLDKDIKQKDIQNKKGIIKYLESIGLLEVAQ